MLTIALSKAKKEKRAKKTSKCKKNKSKNAVKENDQKVQEEQKKRTNDSIQRLAKTINLIKDTVSTSEDRTDEIDVDERTPFERKIYPEEGSMVQARLEVHRSTQARGLTPSHNPSDDTKNFDCFSDRNMNQVDEESLNKTDHRYTNAYNVRNSLYKLRDEHQRNTHFNSSQSKTTKMKKSYIEPEKSRNYFKEIKTDPNQNIITIDELTPSEENKGYMHVYQSIKTPTANLVKLDLSSASVNKSKEVQKNEFSKTMSAGANPTVFYGSKRTRAANSLSNIDKKQYCKIINLPNYL